MKFTAIQDKRKLKELDTKLTMLDRAILKKCEVPMNIVRIIKAAKPYKSKSGYNKFATTEQVLAVVDKLIKLGLLEGR